MKYKEENSKDMKISFEYQQIKGNIRLYDLMKNIGGTERHALMSELYGLSK